MSKDVALLHLDHRTKRLLVAHIKALPEGLYEFSLKRARIARSLKQNAYWHAVIVPHVRAGLQEAWGEKVSRDETHDFLKLKFLARPLINKRTGEVNGYVPGSTRKLSTEEFSDLWDRVTVWAREYLNTEIPPPDKFYAASRSVAPRLDTVGGADVPGVTAEEFERKVSRGCDPDASETRPRGCVVNGVAYPTISAAAKATGITAQAMWKRLRREAQLKAGNP